MDNKTMFYNTPVKPPRVNGEGKRLNMNTDPYKLSFNLTFFLFSALMHSQLLSYLMSSWVIFY